MKVYKSFEDVDVVLSQFVPPLEGRLDVNVNNFYYYLYMLNLK